MNNSNLYIENGFVSREEYLKFLSEDFCVDLEKIKRIANLLGEHEDFDALVSYLNKYEN